MDQLLSPIRSSVSAIERISTSRGCPFRCTFCTTPAVNKLSSQPPYKFRSIPSVITEIKNLHNRGTKHLYINDDLFVVGNKQSKNRALELANALINEKIDITYKIQVRVDSFCDNDTELLTILRDSGLKEVFVGIESGASETLSYYEKDTDRNKNIKFINLMKKIGIKINAGNIPASPDATLDHIEETIDMFSEVDLAFLLFRRVTFKALVFPGTELEKELIDKGRVSQQNRYLLKSYDFSDKRVAKFSQYLEYRMPDYLSQIGGEMFENRNSIYRELSKNGSDFGEFNEVMYLWSKVSSNIMKSLVLAIRSCLDSDAYIDKLFSEYILESKALNERLGSLSTNKTNQIMSGDLF